MKDGIHGKWNNEHMEQVSQICEDFRPKQTNADRIRAMSDEEMSTDLVNIFEELFEDGVPSPERMKMWLQAETE